MRYDLCAASFTINGTQWGANPELYLSDGQSGPFWNREGGDVGATALADSAMAHVFSTQIAGGGFTVPFKQGSPTGRWEGTGQWSAFGATATLTLDVTHAPL